MRDEGEQHVMTVGAAVPEPDIASWPPLDAEKQAPGRQLLAWAADGSGARPRLCLVRGAEGSGKSHLLAWFLAGSGSGSGSGATVHATLLTEGLTAQTCAWELGRQLGYGPLSPSRLLDRVSQDERPLLLLVADLHRAGAGPADLPAAAPATLVTELLEPLLELPHLRAAVEIGDSGLLPPGGADGAEIIDLVGGGHESPAKSSFAELVATVPRTPDGRPDWSQAPAPVHRHIVDAALRADADGEGEGAAVRGLLADPGFLVHGSATALTATLADTRIPAPGRLHEVWQRAAPELTAHHADSAERAALLHAAAVGTDATLAEFLRPLAQRHWWSAVWARPDLPVAALAPTPGDDERRLLTADVTGRIRTYDMDTGTAVAVAAAAAATGSPPSTRPVSLAPRDAHAMLLLDQTGTLLPLAPEDDPIAGFMLGQIAEHHGSAALADDGSQVTALGNGGPQSPYAIVGDQGGNLHAWSLSDYQDTPHSYRVHERPVTAATCLHIPADNLTLTFSAALDGSVRLWEKSGDPMPVPVEQRGALATALAAADTSVGPVLAVAWSDAEIHLWHVFSGRMHVLPLLHPCGALALTADGLLIVGSPEGLYAVRLRLDGLWP
ncbi:WD40 repeat domain-containing protein [Streptomyces sp. NPDC054940]